MQREHVQEALRKWSIDARLQYVRTLTSAVTTAWGVNWDEVYIARDLMQNFFAQFIAICSSSILVKTRGYAVSFSSP